MIKKKLLATFVDSGMSVLEVDNGGNVRNGDVGHLLGLDVHEDQAPAQVIGVLDLWQSSDDLGNDFVDFVIWKICYEIVLNKTWFCVRIKVMFKNI